MPVFGVGREDGHHYFVMQFIAGLGLDVVLEDLRRLRRGDGSASPPAGRGRSDGAVSAAEVAGAILTGRFSPTDRADGEPVPGTDAGGLRRRHRLVTPGRAARPPDSSVGQPARRSADSLARSDPDRPFYRSVARIGIQVAEALEYANRQGILHRDVKPSNLLLDTHGNVWVADFGLAKTAEADDLTHTGDILGTIRYMAPERFAGQCDARSDVYSLGLTLYELLALRPAFEASDRHELMGRVLHEEPERLRKLVPGVPRDLETIVAKAMARDPAERYATAAALAEDLQRFVEDRPIRARRVSAAEQAWRWCRRNPAVASLAAGLLLALVAGSGGRDLAMAAGGGQPGGGRGGQPQGAGAVRPGDGGRPGVHHRGERGRAPAREAAGGAPQEAPEASLSFYDRLAASLEGETDRASRRSLARAVYRRRRAERADRADRKRRSRRIVKAIELRQGLARETPGDATARRELAESELALGDTPSQNGAARRGAAGPGASAGDRGGAAPRAARRTARRRRSWPTGS